MNEGELFAKEKRKERRAGRRERKRGLARKRHHLLAEGSADGERRETRHKLDSRERQNEGEIRSVAEA